MTMYFLCFNITTPFPLTLAALNSMTSQLDKNMEFWGWSEIWSSPGKMQQSPSWEANSCSASQEVIHLLWNPRIHYCVHTSLPMVPIL